MKTTKLILTKENKDYLTAFLTDYLIKCNQDINDKAKSKLSEIINLLLDEHEV